MADAPIVPCQHVAVTLGSFVVVDHNLGVQMPLTGIMDFSFGPFFDSPDRAANERNAK